MILAIFYLVYKTSLFKIWRLFYSFFNIVHSTFTDISKIKNKDFFNIKLKYLVILVIFIFNFKNISRIENEFKRTDLYKFENFPFFAIPEKNLFLKLSQLGLFYIKLMGIAGTHQLHVLEIFQAKLM